jgi:hypothetical protein
MSFFSNKGSLWKSTLEFRENPATTAFRASSKTMDKAIKGAEAYYEAPKSHATDLATRLQI